MTASDGMLVGIDIGGTKIAAALVGADGAVTARRQIPTPARDGAQAILDAVAGLARAVAARADGAVPGYGVGSAGAFDLAGRVVHATDHLSGWKGTAVAAELAARLGAPVAVINDVHAAALGEYLHGSPGPGSALFVAVGTGIGGALVSQGRILHGRSGMSGSVGHVRIPTSEHRVCSCGGQDHVEAYASGPGIELSLAGATGRRLPLPRIAELAAAGDEAAASCIGSAAELLGRSLASAVTVLDPAALVIGGGVARLGDAFIAPLVSALRAELCPPFDRVGVEASVLGNDAALLGAAAAARQQLVAGSVDGCFA